MFSMHLLDLQAPIGQLNEFLALDTLSVLPAPFKLRSRISQGTTMYNARPPTYERLSWSFVYEIS